VSSAAHDPGRAPARVVLVSRHRIERAGLRALLERSGNAVAQEWATLSPSPAMDATAAADVVLVDLEDETAVRESLRVARKSWPNAAVLVLVREFDFARARELVLAGARGVLTKDETAEHLVAAVGKVREHELWLDRAIVARLVDELSAEYAPLPSAATDSRMGLLTDRERQIVELVAQGLCNKSIATRLDISDNTVRHHLTSIFAKLGVHDRLALAVHAIRHRSARGSSA